jgi:hypothetical protein
VCYRNHPTALGLMAALTALGVGREILSGPISYQTGAGDGIGDSISGETRSSGSIPPNWGLCWCWRTFI